MIQKFGRNNRRAAKLGAVQVEEMRREYDLGVTQRELGAKFGVSVGQVGRIVRGESWADTGAAGGFVAREAWAEVGGKEGEHFAGEEEIIAMSLKVLQKRVAMGENPFEENGMKGLRADVVPEEIRKRAAELLGQGVGEGEASFRAAFVEDPEELGPVEVDDLPVG